MTKPESTAGIEKATGKTWTKWVSDLDALGGRDLPHIDIAKTVQQMLGRTIQSPRWWAQSVTVAYEQHIGRRVPGQLSSGLYEVATSKTIYRSRAAVFADVVRQFGGAAQFSDHPVEKPRTSETPNRSMWRCDFADGSKFSVSVEKGDIKCKLVFTHTDIPSKKLADQWKTFWKDSIAAFSDA